MIAFPAWGQRPPEAVPTGPCPGRAGFDRILVMRALRPAFLAVLTSSAVLSALCASPSRAWDAPTHTALASLSLQGDPALGGLVFAESLDDFLASQGETVGQFVSELKLNPSTSFGFKIPGEASGASVRVLDVFSTYINEPDWGMDQGVCAAYAGYCGRDLAFMGAFQRGLPSQAFRHMYWPGGYVKTLNPSLPIPVHVRRPIGQAPDRSQLFFDWSVRAGRAGHPYWAARFLAWSMHYAQDVSQPFHAAQLPSPRLEGRRFGLPDVKRTVKKLTYYHLAFESYVDGLVASEPSLTTAIASAPALTGISAAAVTRAVAAKSLAQARRAADAALAFFPPLPDIDHTDPQTYLESASFQRALAARATDFAARGEFVSIASSCLAEGAGASRALVALYFQQVGSGIAVRRLPAAPARLPARLAAFAAALQR